MFDNFEKVFLGKILLMDYRVVMKSSRDEFELEFSGSS